MQSKRLLNRLETLTDVVFGVTIWRLFNLLPKPEGDLSWGSFHELLASEGQVFVMVALGLAVVIIYWLKNNELFGHLQFSDNKHSALAVLQVFAVLLFLYTMRIGADYEGEMEVRVLESVVAMLIGVPTFLAWRHAMRTPGMLGDSMSSDRASLLLQKSLAEPITALITVPCAFIGPGAWQLAWLTYPLVAWVLRKRMA